MMWPVNSSSVVFSLRLGFYCLLLATVLRIGLAVVIRYAGKWIGTKWRSTAPLVPYVASRLLWAWSELPFVTKWARIVVPAVAIFVTGFMFGRTWQDTTWPTYQYKWVTVKSQTSADTFHLEMANGIEIVAKFCKPVPPLVRGVIMEVFTYQERPDCMYVGRNELIKYHRDAADNVVDAAGRELYIEVQGELK